MNIKFEKEFYTSRAGRYLNPGEFSVFQTGIIKTGSYASTLLIGGAQCSRLWGWLVDIIYKKGNWKLSRRIPAMLGFSPVVVGLLGSLKVETINGAMIFLMLAILGADKTLSPSLSFYEDIGRRNSGAVSGTMNMAGNLGSFMNPNEPIHNLLKT